MSAAVTSTIHRFRARVDAFPDWWLLPLAALGWGEMLPHMLGSGAACHGAELGAELARWMWMVLAMMVLPMRAAVRWTADRSLRAREYRAMFGHLTGYLVPWAVVGMPVSALVVRLGGPSPRAAAAAFATAGLVAATALQGRLRAARHVTIPLAPRGLRADRDCLRLGVLQGGACVAACAPLMLGCALSGHSWVVMLGGAALGAAESYTARQTPRVVMLGCTALAAWAGLRGAG